jgi:hypothetical protein
MKAYEGKDNYYNLLGLKRDASLVEIKSRFRELAKKFHPDRYFHPSQKIWATRQFQKFVEAYVVLSSPEKRRDYDESLNLKDIKVEEAYDERTPKNIQYFWWARMYVYFLPLFFSFFVKLIFHSELSTSLWVVIVYVLFFLLLPWVLLSIFPPFWFVVSSRHTKNMGGLTIMFYILGMMLGIGGVMSFIFNPQEYQELIRHLPMPLAVVTLFYVVSIVLFFVFTWERIKIKENLLVYPALAVGLIISAICATYSFKKTDWTGFFIFAFYIAACFDFFISTISYERLRMKLDKKLHDTGMNILLITK